MIYERARAGKYVLLCLLESVCVRMCVCGCVCECIAGMFAQIGALCRWKDRQGEGKGYGGGGGVRN